MEDKRTIIAIVLSIVVLIGWTHLAEYMGWVQPRTQEARQEAAPSPAPTPEAVVSTAPATPAPVFTPAPGREVKVETPLYSAVIYTGGGVLRSFTLKNYKSDLQSDSPLVNLVSPDAALTSPMGVTVNGQASWSVGSWSFDGGDLALAPGEAKSLTFIGMVDGVRVTRTLTFHADTYLISENLLVASADATPRSARLGFVVAASPFGEGAYDPTRLAWDSNGSFEEETSADTLMKTGIIETGTFNWAGVMSNYFMNVVSPADPLQLTLRGRVQGEVWRAGLERPEFVTPVQGETPVAVNWWFGPKVRTLLEEAPGNLSNAVHFGIF